jgi:hypothetical protein
VQSIVGIKPSSRTLRVRDDDLETAMFKGNISNEPHCLIIR